MHKIKKIKTTIIRRIFCILHLQILSSVGVQKSKMYIILAFITAFTSFFIHAHTVGEYTIIAPQFIHPMSEYHVSISIHNISEPCKLRLSIKGQTNSNIQLTKDVNVEPKSSQLVKFKVEDLPTDQYILITEGLSGLIFEDQKTLIIGARNILIFLHTDKTIYKPSDLIRFQLFVLDDNLRPFYDEKEKPNIYVKDGQNNLIGQWLNVKTTMGVYTNYLQLADSPVLGQWTFSIEIMGKVEEKTILVVEYVLPKFEVNIIMPKHLVFKDNKIRATIKSSYSYGKPVSGEVTVSVFPTFHGSYQPLIHSLITRKVMKTNGLLAIEYNIINDLNITEDYSRDLVMEAIVEEEFTGRKQNTSFIFTLHKSIFLIKTTESPSVFKPGLPVEIMLQVARHDGLPLDQNLNEKLITLQSVNLWEEHPIEKSYSLTANGFVKIHFTVPQNQSTITIAAKYLDANELIANMSMENSINGAFIKAYLKNENNIPIINKEVVIEVRSTERMESFSYIVVGRSDIILANTVNVPDKADHTFKFLATFTMVPYAKVFVYYIKGNEIVSDELPLRFMNDLQNFINLEIPIQRSHPGQSIDIAISTRPNSFVGLMAIDRNSEIFYQEHDLSTNNLFKELLNNGALHKRHLQGKLAKKNNQLENMGLFLITNAVKYSADTNQILNEHESSSEVTSVIKSDIGPAHKFKTNTRPPLAGPYAFSWIPKPFSSKPKVYLAHQVVSSWVFANITSGFDGHNTIHENIPNVLTTWDITGYSIDALTGLGLTKIPFTLDVSKSFYVSLDLPFAIKFGEIISVPVVVFNNAKNEIIGEATLHNTDQEFEFVQISSKEKSAPKVELYRRKKLMISSMNVSVVNFIIRPKKVGQIKIKVTASTSGSSDIIERVLTVNHEGLTEYKYTGVFIDLRQSPEFLSNFTTEVPKNAVPDSTKIEVAVSGDIVGASVRNMRTFLRKPVNSGEQNLLHFVSSALLANYLGGVTGEVSSFMNEAIQLLETGYQRELVFKHKDGSFSAFGENNGNNGSTWLTAFVIKSLHLASDYIMVESQIIDQALMWLSNIQALNGSFPEVGDIYYQNIQRDGGNGVALTSYVLIAFLENKKKYPHYQNVINKAMDFIVRNLEDLDDVYSLAIGSYALQLAEHNSREFILQLFDRKALVTKDYRYWTLTMPEMGKKNSFYQEANSINTEITSYGLLAFLEAGHLTDALPILKWLIAQRSELGGFQSTQDTVIGLEAILKYYNKIKVQDSNIQVKFSYYDKAETRINVNPGNSLTLQTYELKPTTELVNVSASGHGLAFAQLTYQYNLNVTAALPRFTLDPVVNKNSKVDYLHLSICTSFITDGAFNESNMAIMEVSFPSGFTVDVDKLQSVEASINVRKVETKNDNTVVIIYFIYLNRTEFCPTLNAYRTYKIANLKAASVVLYDYYDTSRQARMFYLPTFRVNLCDICDSTECDDNCDIQAEKQKSNPNNEPNEREGVFNEIWKSSASAKRTSSLMFIFLQLFNIVYFLFI